MLSLPQIAHVAVCTLACGAVCYPAYTNVCGDTPVHARGTGYVEWTGPGETSRPFLTMLGIQMGMIGSAAAMIDLKFARITYAAFGLTWLSVMLSWHSPCGNHSLSAGLYLALGSTVAAVLSALLTTSG
jgi:hypothetical protein